MSWLSLRSFFNLIIVNHSIAEVYDAEILYRLVQFVQIFHDIANAAWAMPLPGVLVVDEAHSRDILNRETTLFTICIIVH